MPRPQRSAARSRHVLATSTPVKPSLSTSVNIADTDADLTLLSPISRSTPPLPTRALRDISNSPTKNPAASASAKPVLLDLEGTENQARFAPVRRPRPTTRAPGRSSTTRRSESTTILNKPEEDDGEDDPFGFSKVDKLTKDNLVFAPIVKPIILAISDPQPVISPISSSPIRPEADDPAVLEANDDDDDDVEAEAEEEANKTMTPPLSRRVRRRKSPPGPHTPTTDELVAILPPRKHKFPSTVKKTIYHTDDEDELEEVLSSSSVDDDAYGDEDYGKAPSKRARTRAPTRRRRGVRKQAEKPASDADLRDNDEEQEVNNNDSDDDAEKSFILPKDENDNLSMDAYTQQLKDKFAEIDKWELVVETVSEESLIESQ